MGSFLLNKEAVFAELASSKKQDDGVLCCLTYMEFNRQVHSGIDFFIPKGGKKNR
jgi:hypothetical protein